METVGPAGPGYADRRRAGSFGEIAERYDRYRPGYPPALFDDLLQGGTPRVLDVGCGTGKAGRMCAARGCRVLGVELDERMARVARSHGIDVEVARFEQWDPGGREFDLVISAQAWHWVEPAAGAVKAGSVLRPGGRFAAFWNRGQYDAETKTLLDDVYRRLGPDTRLEDHARETGEAAVGGLVASEMFAGIEIRRGYASETLHTRDEWLDHLGTHSDNIVLPPRRREALFKAVGDAIDSLGGTITVYYNTDLITALRR